MGPGDGGDSLRSDQKNGSFAQRRRAIYSATVDPSWGANPSFSLGAVEHSFASDWNILCMAMAQHTDDFSGFAAASSSSDLGVDEGIVTSGGNLIRQVSGLLPCFNGVDGDVARLQDSTAPLAANNHTTGRLGLADEPGISEENSRGKMPDCSDFDSQFSFGNIQTKRGENVERERGSRSQGKAAPKPDKELSSEGDPPTDEYIHLRAKRGHATNSHSLAERLRRQKISERMKFLQDLVPGCSKMTGKAVMLDEIINYIQSLQRQVEFLSMKLATVNPGLNPDMEATLSNGARWIPGRKALHSQAEGGSDIFDLGHGFASSQRYVQGGSQADIVAPEVLVLQRH